MFDTVKFYTAEYDIARDSKFKRDVVTDYSTGKFERERVFCNLPNGVKFDIKRKGDNELLFCELSLPRVIHGSSLKEMQENDLDQSLVRIDDLFKTAGVILDVGAVEKMKLSRLDCSKNIHVDHSPVDYLAQLRNCSFGRRVRTDWRHETVLFYNGSQEFTAYNKIKEIKDHKHTAAAGIYEDTPETVLRLESRMKNSNSVSRIMRASTLPECYNFKTAKEKILGDLDHLILNIGEQTELNFNDDLCRLLTLREKTRYSWQLFLAENGTELFLAKYGYDMALVKKLLLEAYSRRQAYNILKSLRLFIAERRTKEQRDLLKELRFKLAA